MIVSKGDCKACEIGKVPLLILSHNWEHTKVFKQGSDLLDIALRSGKLIA
jgi:hypothetical protein